MTTWKCHACEAITDGDDMRRVPARRDEPGYILCPCGSDDFQECWPCDECGDECIETEFEEGTDLCRKCWIAENPDTGNLEAAALERLRGIE